MNNQSKTETPKSSATKNTPPVESELRRFGMLLDRFFAKVAI
jgi:hypothetical protein